VTNLDVSGREPQTDGSALIHVGRGLRAEHAVKVVAGAQAIEILPMGTWNAARPAERYAEARSVRSGRIAQR
jgi:hypothetical protein